MDDAGEWKSETWKNQGIPCFIISTTCYFPIISFSSMNHLALIYYVPATLLGAGESTVNNSLQIYKATCMWTENMSHARCSRGSIGEVWSPCSHCLETGDPEWSSGQMPLTRLVCLRPASFQDPDAVQCGTYPSPRIPMGALQSTASCVRAPRWTSRLSQAFRWLRPQPPSLWQQLQARSQSWAPPTQGSRRNNNKLLCKPLSFEVVCYGAMDNWMCISFYYNVARSCLLMSGQEKKKECDWLAEGLWG